MESLIKDDSIKGGNFLTYLLLEEQGSTYYLLGLLRYRNATNEEFIEQVEKTSILDDIRKNIDSLLSLKKYDIIYLSRIGVSQEYQEMRVSQIISNFFEFLIQRNKKDVPEVPLEAKRGLKFKFVKNANEVLKLALDTN